MDFSDINLPKEHFLKLNINDKINITLICTNDNLKELIVGYLYNEGIISDIREIEKCDIIEDRSVGKVLVKDLNVCSCNEVRTSGLGSIQLNTNMDVVAIPVNNKVSISHIRECAKHMEAIAKNYRKTGGMHSSGLFDKNGIYSYCSQQSYFFYITCKGIWHCRPWLWNSFI